MLFLHASDVQIIIHTHTHIYIYDLVPKGVHENRTKGVENKVDDTLKLVVFLECHSVHGCPFLAVIFRRFFSVL